MSKNFNDIDDIFKKYNEDNKPEDESYEEKSSRAKSVLDRFNTGKVEEITNKGLAKIYLFISVAAIFLLTFVLVLFYQDYIDFNKFSDYTTQRVIYLDESKLLFDESIVLQKNNDSLMVRIVGILNDNGFNTKVKGDDIWANLKNSQQSTILLKYNKDASQIEVFVKKELIKDTLLIKIIDRIETEILKSNF